MPTLAELIEKNKQRYENGGKPGEPPVVEAPIVLQHPGISQDVPIAPIRGSFPAGLITGTDFSNSTKVFRTAQSVGNRTAVFPTPTSNSAQVTVQQTIAAAQAAANKAISASTANSNAIKSVVATVQSTQNNVNSIDVPPITTIASTGLVDSTQTYFSAKGVVPPTIAGGFAYTSTTTSVTWYWDGTNGSSLITIYRADGSSTAIAGGNQSCTGLSSNTLYDFYPAYNEVTKQLFFVTGSSGQIGTPAIALKDSTATPTQFALITQTQNLLINAQLVNGPLQVTTPSSGSGGGGGGSRVCVRIGSLVEHEIKGIIRVEQCEVGDWILSREGWTQIKIKTVEPAWEFVKIITDEGESVQIRPHHQMTLADGSSIAACRLCLEDVLIGRNGFTFINHIDRINEDSKKVQLYCEPYHEYYAGDFYPAILVHNSVPVC